MLCWPTNQGISKVCGMCRSLFFHLIALVAKKLIGRWNICICLWDFICVCVCFFIFLLNVSISHHSSARAGGKKLIETWNIEARKKLKGHQLASTGQTNKQAGFNLICSFWVRAGWSMKGFTKCTQSSFTVRLEVQIRKGTDGIVYL